MQILNEIDCRKWDADFSFDIKNQAIAALEAGKIIYFPSLPFLLLNDENHLLSPSVASPTSKNISFDCTTGLLRGAANNNCSFLKKMIQRFSEKTELFLQTLFPDYKTALQKGRTSFRPVEIAGRVSSYRKDDTRLHVDAFPATPNQGRRIVRVFTNINPHEQSRLWRVGEPFLQVIHTFLPGVSKYRPMKSFLLNALKITKQYRSEYDHIMLNIHDGMKADMLYQQKVNQCEMAFPPGSTWIVQTDHVSHAAMAGQHVLEQTFYLPVNAMRDPSLSPLRMLEKEVGRSLCQS